MKQRVGGSVAPNLNPDHRLPPSEPISRLSPMLSYLLTCVDDRVLGSRTNRLQYFGGFHVRLVNSTRIYMVGCKQFGGGGEGATAAAAAGAGRPTDHLHHHQKNAVPLFILCASFHRTFSQRTKKKQLACLDGVVGTFLKPVHRPLLAPIPDIDIHMAGQQLA